MLKFLLFCISVLFAFEIVAQRDSISVEIQNYPDSQFETIRKARRMIIDKLYKDEFQKINQIKDFLLTKYNGNHEMVFGLKEFWLLLFWSTEYDELLENISNIGLKADSIISRVYTSNNSYFLDQFDEQLLSKSRASKNILEALIEDSEMNQEEKEFLNLLLGFCLADFSSSPIVQDSLNQQSTDFIRKYPWSSYLPFIKRVIRYQVKVSDLGLGYDFYGGYGMMEGNISAIFAEMGYFGFSFSFYYMNFNLDFSVLLGSSKLKRDIPVKSITWNNGMNASIVIPFVHFGYTLLPSSKVNFTPFFGISGTFISPLYEDMLANPYLDNISFNSNICWSAGASINFFSKPTTIFRSFNKSTQVQLILRLQYAYSNISYSKINYQFNGQMHQVSLFMGCRLNKIHRII